MTFTILETSIQILTQDILPLTSTPIRWTFMCMFGVMVILHGVCFPCVTLDGLEHRVQHCLLLICVIYEQTSEAVAYEFSGKDHSASWIKYLSLRRVWTISQLYRKLDTLQKDIKHAKIMILKRRNDKVLELLVHAFGAKV
ncbi:hypothetical protein J3R30DRAFT_3401574 [Lentinula aciculospora]|uniref:Uncharacterized protein n=1 Tax=Lentinula aciculospora TaxID=153920 RepID=A0A9W9ANG8_9AGAR|nr:hypothetical protein J3R30DRAFT_3401574 [Lentinula aciculospora]